MSLLNIINLCGVTVVTTIITAILSVLICVPVSIFLLTTLNKKKNETLKSSLKDVVENAEKEAVKIKKEALFEAKEEIQKLKDECDKELKERRFEISKNENRLIQKEEYFNRKEESLDKKTDMLESAKLLLKEKEDSIQTEIDKQKSITKNIVSELEKVSKMTKDEAKNELIAKMEDQAKQEAAVIVREIEQTAKDQANKKAKEIITLAIQKTAVEHTSEITVSTVSLPNDEMKGRLIGREGRNIRALESATGVELIIDDTPEAIVISCFDPVRREIAKTSIEKLMLDGRIQPARIEEMVEKVTRDIEMTIKEKGESAAYDAGIHGLHPELIKLLGRLHYRTSYGQNVLNHSLEVAYISGLLAAEIGADVQIAKRGGLLHDIGKAVDHEIEGSHDAIGYDLASKFKENKGVLHCIEAHHGAVEYNSLEAIIVQTADAISAARPGARRESLENYIKRLKQLESIANTFKGVDKSFAIQAGREIRIIVKPEEISDEDALFMSKDIAKKIENEMQYPGQIKVNIIRETRAVDYAK